MMWRNLDAKIDKFSQQVSSAIEERQTGGHPDWDSIWQLERDIQSEFDIPVRYPTKQDHDRAWERFSAARNRLGESRRLYGRVSGPRRGRRSKVRIKPRPRSEHEPIPGGLDDTADSRHGDGHEWFDSPPGRRRRPTQVHHPLALVAASFGAGAVFGACLLVLLVSGFAIGPVAWLGLVVILLALVVLVLWLAT